MQQDQHVNNLMGCEVTFGDIPEGLQAWLKVRWLHPLDLARDFQVHLQTGHTPQAAKNAQPHNRATVTLFEQQLEVATMCSPAHQARVNTPDLVRVAVQNSASYSDEPVWLELADKHATLTLPRGQDIHQDAAEVGVWQGSMSPYPLVTCLQEALRAAGLYPIHGACAQSPQGQTALFLGASGTGKTTTLLRALQAGWSAVAEDVVWLEADTRHTYSLEKGLRVFKETLPQLDPLLAKRDWGKLVMGKTLLPYKALAAHYGGTEQVQGTPLSHVVQLVRPQDTRRQISEQQRSTRQMSTRQRSTLKRSTRQRSTWQPLDKRQLAVALWQGLGMPLSKTLREQLAGYVPHWLEAVQGWQLSLGDDVAEVLAQGLPHQ